MMEKITINQAQKATSPNPIALVCTRTPEGKTNLAAVSWWTYLANKPPMLGICMSNKGYTGELIQSGGSVVLALPGGAIATQAFQCGTMSGRSVDKAEQLQLDLMELPDVDIQVPVHSRLVFSCTLESTAPAGDHTLYVCTVNDVFYNGDEQQLFAWEGYASLRPL